MRIDFTGRKADISERERIKIKRKFDKIQRILTRRGGLEAHVTLSRQRHLREAEVTLRALRHTLVVTGSGVSAFAALHAALGRLEKQVLRNKRKIIDTHRPGRQRDRPSPLVEDALRRLAAELPPVEEERPAKPAIVRSRRLEAKPMTAEEALLALDSGKREYVSFRDAYTGRINVLIRLRDGTAELVEGG
jgi:putative sigma-54 modulation protein